jgi:hypothetical protein
MPRIATSGKFTIGENDPGSSWVQGDFSCNYANSQEEPVTGASPQFTLEAGQAWTCQITNTKKGNVIIKKTAIGGNGTFNFTAGAPVGNRSVPTAGGTGQTAAIQVPANTTTGYVVTESGPPSGWDFTLLSCNNPDGLHASSTSGQAATFRVDPGETVTCTWTNTARGHVIVKNNLFINALTSFNVSYRLGRPSVDVRIVNNTFIASGNAAVNRD